MLLFLLVFPAVVQADDFSCVTNNGEIAITRYLGPGSAVTVPDFINGLPVTSIGDFAFASCTNVTSITMPNSVTMVGQSAFDRCNYLASVRLSDALSSIQDGAFASCGGLTNVMIPSGVTNIGSGAFYACTSLTGVYFQSNAPSLGPNAFTGGGSPIIYFLPGKTGWGATFGGRPTAVWQPHVLASDSGFGVRTNQFGFNIAWAEGMTVVVEACTDLASSIWTPVGTNTLTGGSSYFSDPQWTNYPARFYRVRWP